MKVNIIMRQRNIATTTCIHAIFYSIQVMFSVSKWRTIPAIAPSSTRIYYTIYLFALLNSFVTFFTVFHIDLL